MERIRWGHGFSYNGQHVQEQTVTPSSVQDKLLHGHLVSSKLQGLIWKKSIFSLVRPHQVIHQVIHQVLKLISDCLSFSGFFRWSIWVVSENPNGNADYDDDVT